MDKIRQDSTLYVNYLTVLKDRFYKCLCLFEENNVGIFSNINSLIFELSGLENIIENLENDYRLLTLIATLESLLDESLSAEYDIPTIKREVFKCMTTIDKMIGDEV